MKKPNILWICTDQQRYDTLGCYGNSFVKTPNLDKLAERGVKFEYAYSQSPVCSPSRASFMTGRYPSVTKCRQNGQAIDNKEVLVTKILKDNGYNCGLSGKLHIAPCHYSVCKTTEERIDDGYSVFHWSHHPDKLDNKKGNYANNEYSVWLRENGQSFERKPYEGSEQVQTSVDSKYHQTTWCVNKAVSFIEANADYDSPWLFSVNLYDPHHPFDPPRDYLERYMDILEQLPLPNYTESELDDKPIFQQKEFANGAYNNNKKFVFEGMTKHDHRLVKAAYYAMIDLIDEQIGRLIDSLEKTGQLENTVIIFHSDHGEMLGDHGLYMKGPYFYEGAVRVPLIISWQKKFVQGYTYDGLVELTDLAPTILDAADIPIYPGMQGKSFINVLNGKDHNGRDSVFSEYYNAMSGHKDPKPYLTMVRNKQYKLVCQHFSNAGELYNLSDDPKETHNLWFDSNSAAIKTDMLKLMCDRLAQNCDPLPIRQADY